MHILQDMRTAVTSLQTSVAKMTVQDLHARLTALPKIQVPIKTVSSANEKQDSSKDSSGEPGNVSNNQNSALSQYPPITDLGQLMTRCNKARQELYSLMANQTVVDITRY